MLKEESNANKQTNENFRHDMSDHRQQEVLLMKEYIRVENTWAFELSIQIANLEKLFEN